MLVKYGFDSFVRCGFEVRCSLTSAFESLGRSGFRKTEHTQGGIKTLLYVFPGIHDLNDGIRGCRPDFRGLCDKPLFGPPLDERMVGRHVLGFRGVTVVRPAGLVAAEMNVIVIYFDNGADLINAYPFSREVIGHAVMMVLEPDMVIRGDTHVCFNPGYSEWFGRQLLGVGLVQLFETLPPRLPAVFFHGAVVERFK